MELKKAALLFLSLTLIFMTFLTIDVSAQDNIQGCIRDCTKAQQIIKSSGFEDGTTQGWQPFGNPILTPTTAVAHTGLFSLEISNRTASFMGPSFDLTGRVLNMQRFTVSAFVFYTGGNDNETFRITVLRRVAGAADLFTNIAVVSVPRGQWTELKGSYTLDFQGTLQDVLTYIECDNATLTFNADDILISSPGAPNLQRNIPSVAKVYQDKFRIGSAVNLNALGDNLLNQLLKMHFNSITPENDLKPLNIEPQEGVFTFDRADQYVNFAQVNNFYMRGHVLVWHQQNPSWLFVDANGDPVTRDVLLARMQNYIQTVVGRYAGKINAWDVVNEAIDTTAPNNLRVSPWLQIIGPDYIDKAFIFAHAADPNARLFYNDFNTEDPAKRQAIFNLVKGLKQRGVPIDGIGIEGHISIFFPSVDEVKTTIRTFSKLGVELQITELDMSLYSSTTESGFDCPPQDRLIQQGEKYAKLFEVFRDNKKFITNVTFWGLKDDLSWLNNFFVVRNDFPLIFDPAFRAKYAYWGVVDPCIMRQLIKIDESICKRNKCTEK